MYLACTHFFLCHVRNGVMRPRRIPKGNYGLVTTVGTTFYAITRLCFTAGALTHLPELMRDVYRFVTRGRTHLFDDVVTDHYQPTSCFRWEKHELVIDIVALELLRRKDTVARKSRITRVYEFSFFVPHACGMHHPPGVNRN